MASEYVSPMFGFVLPGLGRSRTSDWTIAGGHLAERCQLIVIVALGESVLVTGATFSSAAAWDGLTVAAFGTAFAGGLAMWWLYFDTSSQDGSHAIEHADDPGRLGAAFHYVHVVLLAGVIVAAVGNELVIAHPHGHVGAKELAVLLGGAAIYLVGNAGYKQLVYRRVPGSHLAGLAALALLLAAGTRLELLPLAVLTLVVLIVVAAWDGCVRRG